MNHILYTSSPSRLEISTRDVLRYLNVREPDEELLALVNDCLDEAVKVAQLKAVYVRTNVALCGDKAIFDFIEMESKSLCKFIDGCDEAYIFVATMGIKADMLVNRYLKTDPSRGVIFNAACVSVIEAFCDKLNGYLLKTENSSKRFSPGYGDLKLEYQRELLTHLDSVRKIGVSLTDGCLMVPTKSVSAIIGIK